MGLFYGSAWSTRPKGYMTCYHPLTLYKVNYSTLATKKQPLRGLLHGGDPTKPVQVPCSKCWGCRLERARQWSIRCMHEKQMHDESCFITLTYNDEHVTHGGQSLTLYPRDLQLFLKRLRKKYGQKIKFFACGEYGEKKGRPHYHALIFGLDFKDRIPIPTRGENPLYTSPSLQQLWSANNMAIGDVSIGDVTFESASYVARYIMKKKLGKTAGHYKRVGIEPEFTRMSRRPGIGAGWYDKYKSDVYPQGYCVIRGGIKSPPPKYYNSKYELTNPIEYDNLRKQKEKEALKRASDNTHSRLATRERVKKCQTKSLLRKLD